MPLTGSFKQLDRRLAQGIADLAKPGGKAQAEIAEEAIRAVKELVRDQFATGSGPDGTAQEKTARGKLALVSKRLGRDVIGQVLASGTGAAFKLLPDWLEAHQVGHVFPARKGGGDAQFFNKAGRRIALGALTKRALRMKFIEERVAKVHEVRARVLPARPIVPVGGLTDRWKLFIGLAAQRALERWAARIAR